MFYDLRGGKYLESNVAPGRTAILKASAGCIYSNEEMVRAIHGQHSIPAIYTHCIDMSGTRIFTAGGPSSIVLGGNYVGLWH